MKFDVDADLGAARKDAAEFGRLPSAKRFNLGWAEFESLSGYTLLAGFPLRDPHQPQRQVGVLMVELRGELSDGDAARFDAGLSGLEPLPVSFAAAAAYLSEN